MWACTWAAEGRTAPGRALGRGIVRGHAGLPAHADDSWARWPCSGSAGRSSPMRWRASAGTCPEEIVHAMAHSLRAWAVCRMAGRGGAARVCWVWPSAGADAGRGACAWRRALRAVGLASAEGGSLKPVRPPGGRGACSGPLSREPLLPGPSEEGGALPPRFAPPDFPEGMPEQGGYGSAPRAATSPSPRPPRR
jgi:hypothetical protein